MPISWRPRRGMDDILRRKLTGKIFVSTLRPSWLIFSNGTITTRLTETVKRVLDITFSIAGLMLSAPFMVFAVACIKLTSKGPILVPTRTGGEALVRCSHCTNFVRCRIWIPKVSLVQYGHASMTHGSHG